MDALETIRYNPSRRGNRRTGRQQSNVSLPAKDSVRDSALANNAKPSVEAQSYKSVLSSRPPTAAGSDVPADDRGADSYTSLLFAEHAWNPHDALLDLPPEAKSLRDPVSAPPLDADDESFFSLHPFR